MIWLALSSAISVSWPVARSSSHSRSFLSEWAMYLPSGDGMPSQRSSVAPVVSCFSALPSVGTFQNSTSPLLSESVSRDLPFGMKRAMR
jgi:hypothetical protein